MAFLRLTSLTLEGFKSFASRVELSFPGAIIAIVGPNGTGKSNIADAIAWVLGEQSARLLRSQQMADVIFAGSPDRPALGAAEVTLTLRPESSWEDGGLEISRRVYRDGTSDYRIGGKRARLKDVMDRLMDASLGTRAYAIIEQGRIGQVLSLRATDRRALFEEAAGITKFRARRHEAELKLAETRANLVRVADITSEVRRTLDQVRRQARRAERHRELRNELAGVRGRLFAGRREQGEALLAARQEELTGRSLHEAELAAALALVEADVERRRRELDAARESLAAARAQEAASDGAAQRAEAEEEAARREQDEATARQQGAVLEAQRLAARLEAEAGQEQVLTGSAAEAARLHGEADAAAQQAAGAHAAAEAASRDASARAEEARRALLAAVAAAAEGRNRAHRIGVEVEQTGYQRGRLTAEQERLAAHLTQAGSAEEEAAARHARAVTGEQEASAARQELRQRRDELVARRLAATTDRDRAGHERWQAHHERDGVLRALASARALPEALAKSLPDHELLGTVADFLDPSPELAARLDRAYREVLNLPVVAGEAALQRLLDQPPRADGTVEVVVREDAGEARPSPLLADAGARADSAAWLSRALPRAAVAASAEEGRALAAADPDLVVLLPDGSRRRGPRVELPGAQAKLPGVLGLRVRARQLATAEAAAQQREGTLVRELDGLQSELATLATALADADAAVTREAEAVAAASSVRETMHRERSRLQRELEALAAEGARLAAEAESLAGRLEAAKTEAERLTGRAAELEETVARLAREADAAREAAASARAHAERMAGQAAVARERRAAADREVERHRETLAELQRQLAATCAQEVQERERAATAGERGGAARTALQEHLTRRALARSQVEALAAGEEALRGSVAAAAADAERQRAGHLAARDATHVARLAVAEAAAELGRLDEAISLTLGADARLPETPATPEEVEALAESDRRLAAELESLGPVNELALAERDELETRFAFLQEQRRDLERSLASLTETIAELDRECAERFRATLAEAGVAFAEIFRTLFGGGDATIELADPDSPLDAGVEIRVRPPGKHTQSVLLLSGGEKALAAIALLLALFRIRPAPFCVLDEVDAPLDDANVERLCQHLRELSRGTQFLLITHNRRTMAHADVLYGVTMAEPGVSSIVSVRLEE
jgi:chromosome segregation protein